MATTIIKNEYSVYDESKSLPADEIFIDVADLGRRCINTFYYKDKSTTKPITSYKQLVEQAKKNNVFSGPNKMKNISDPIKKEIENLEAGRPSKFEKKNIEIPTYVDSISINTVGHKVPYGVKRNVKMSVPEEESKQTHALVKIDGELMYIEKSSIYFMAPDGKQTIDKTGKRLDDDFYKDKVLYDGKTGKAISEIYTVNFFTPEKIVAEEIIDFETLTHTDYQSEPTKNGTQVVGEKVVDSEGVESLNIEGNTYPIETTFSEHTYVQNTIEGKAGKTETVSQIEARNFVYDPPSKDFIIVEGKKIFLDQIAILEISVLKTDRAILESDLGVGKTIIYKNKTKTKKLTEDILSSLTVEKDGRKKLEIDGDTVYLDDIDEVSEFTHNPTKKDFKKVECTITYADSDGNMTTKDLTAGQTVVKNDKGDHVYVTVNGRGQMVPLNMLRDETNPNQPIANIEEMVGKKLTIVEEVTVGDNKQFVPVAETDEITYEQANMQYSTRKTFQPSDKTKADNSTYRKLETGEMVKESMINVPKAYKRTTEATGDAWLVEIDDGSSKRHVIVDKEYFNRYGDTTTIKSAKAEPVVRCEVGDNDCVAIQTTSRGKEIEECKFLGDLTNEADKANAKKDSINAVKTGIENGQYIIDDALNRERNKYVKLEEGGERYEYTDKVTIPDYAENDNYYNGLEATGISIEDGKVVGGIKYKMAKSLKKDFSKWGEIIGTGGLVAMASIFIPVVGPLAAISYGAVVIGGPAFIVGKHAIKAAIKNNLQIRLGIPFKDKAKYNQKALEKEINADIEKLYERMQSNDASLTKENFEHEIASLKQRAYALSRATDNSSIKSVNGVAQVTKLNANAAIKFKKEYASTLKARNKLEKDLAEARKELAKNKISPEEFTAIENKFKHYDAKLNALKNGEFTEQSLDAMKRNTKAFVAANDAVANAEAEIKKLNKQLINAKGKKRDKLLQKLAQQEKLRDENKRILNEESTISENLNSTKTRNKEVAKSENCDLIFESIEDMRAVVYLKKFKDSKEVKDIIDALGIDASVIDSIGYDKKLGITYDGKALDEALIHEETRDIIIDMIDSAIPNIQQTEKETAEHYDDLSKAEERMAAEDARNKEVEEGRAREQAEAKQMRETHLENERNKESNKTKNQILLRAQKIELSQQLREEKSNLALLYKLQNEVEDLETKLADVKMDIRDEQRNQTNINNIIDGNNTIINDANVRLSDIRRKILLSAANPEAIEALRQEEQQLLASINAATAENRKWDEPLRKSNNKLTDLKNEQAKLESQIAQKKKDKRYRRRDELMNETVNNIKRIEQEMGEVNQQLDQLLKQIEKDDKSVESAEASAE